MAGKEEEEEQNGRPSLGRLRSVYEEFKRRLNLARQRHDYVVNSRPGTSSTSDQQGTYRHLSPGSAAGPSGARGNDDNSREKMSDPRGRKRERSSDDRLDDIRQALKRWRREQDEVRQGQQSPSPSTSRKGELHRALLLLFVMKHCCLPVLKIIRKIFFLCILR